MTSTTSIGYLIRERCPLCTSARVAEALRVLDRRHREVAAGVPAEQANAVARTRLTAATMICCARCAAKPPTPYEDRLP